MEIIVSPITYQSKPATIGTIIDITEEVEKEKRISKAVIDAQENERRLMSMELHDNVKQILTATVLNVDFIDMALNDKETLNRIVGNVKRYLREAIEELRRISHRLSPSIDSVLSLEEKVKALVRSMNVSDGVKVVYHFDDFKKPIEDDIQLMLYRILQEQLTNIAKHANASLIEIALRDDNGNIEMMVQDNGDGFDTRTTKSGIGLENIKRRLTALDGRMEIVSSPGNGCRMVIRIPEESRGEL
jgi:signal transduction histidine kinase